MTPTTIKKVQQALKYAGFYSGPIDGIWSLEAFYLLGLKMGLSFWR